MKKKIRKRISATIQAVNLNRKVGIQQSGVNMSYDFIEDCIYVDLKRVIQARLEMPQPVDLPEYIKALTLHELGHALDREALLTAMPRMIEIARIKRENEFVTRRKDIQLFSYDIEAHKMDIAFEKTAWGNARVLNAQYGIVSWSIFEQVENHSMSSYYGFYEKDLTDYKRLVAAERMQREASLTAIMHGN